MRRICTYKKMLSLTSNQEKEELNVALVVKNLPGNAGDLKTEGLIWGQEDPLEEGMATHFSIFAWRIPWTEEPGGPWSIGSQRVRHDWSNLARACAHMEIFQTHEIAKELMLLNYDVGEDSWESLGLQGYQISQSWRKSVLNIHWKDWCWSSNTLTTWFEELTH